MTTPTSIAELTAAFPDLVAQIRNEALAGASSTATPPTARPAAAL